ncbi:MAG: hypothetical protein AABW68_03880 [archaeon]
MKFLGKGLILGILLCSLALPAMGIAAGGSPKMEVPEQAASVFCPVELGALHADASAAVGFDAPPISKVIQVYGILPGKELGPIGVILNFEGSTMWYAKQQPFSDELKWGFGGWRTKEDGSTHLGGLLVPVGGTIVDFDLMSGEMVPLKVPLDSLAIESGALTILPEDPSDPNVWIYGYSSYAPNDWNCEQGNFFI